MIDCRRVLLQTTANSTAARIDQTSMKLWVIRHAKSSWDDPSQADFDRPLSSRGRKDGNRMIKWMREQRLRPNRLLSSDAVRARATTEFVRNGYEIAAHDVNFDHRLYLAEPETILDVVRELPEDCTSVALVGHNPGSTEFVNAMMGGGAIAELPTFAVALLDLPGRWADTKFGTASLVALQTPKQLRD
jgi:phosphohistidine phosphatase